MTYLKLHHAIQNDIDYDGALIFEAVREREGEREDGDRRPHEHSRDRPPHVAPHRMVPTENPEDLPPAPPPVSGYREADIQGVACWNCGHFTACADSDGDDVVDGICNLWETQSEGEFTCDRFTAHPDLFRQAPHTSWAEDQHDDKRDGYDKRYDRGVTSVDYSDDSSLNEIRFSGDDASESGGLVWKRILRTGVWNTMPTTQGVIKKRLQIVKDGVTNIAQGIISLSELKKNFDDEAVPYVTVPLSDEEGKDHKNIAALNTGLVKKLKLVEDGGTTFLAAGIDFTNPEVKARVLRGEIPDVSAGIPANVMRRSDDKIFSGVLDHVCLTRKPFIDGLGPFGIAAADSDENLDEQIWEPTEAEAPAQDTPSFKLTIARIESALVGRLVDPASYEIEDAGNDFFVIRHRTSGVTWKASYKRQGDIIEPQAVNEWKIVDKAPEVDSEKQSVPVAASDLQRAHEMRELRFSQPTSNSGGIQMSVLNLDGVELSDEQRDRIQGIMAENESLRQRTRNSEVDARIAELQKIPGLSDRPGALKLYRDVMLADDEGPAIILLSDSGKEKSKMTATQILDQFIDAIKGDNGVQFSDQALASGNDVKPATTAVGEVADLDTRVANSQEALYGKNGRRRTGRR